MFCDLCTWDCLGEFFPSFPHVPVFYFVVSNTDLKWSQGTPHQLLTVFLSLEPSHTGKLINRGWCPENETGNNTKRTWVVFTKRFSTRTPEILSR